MFSLSVQQGVFDDPAVRLALEVAQLLARHKHSPFSRMVRFDSKQVAKGSRLKPLPVSTICAQGASDVGTSLVGLARVGLAGAHKASWLADTVIAATSALDQKAQELLRPDKALTPPLRGGTLGSSTMLIGLAVLLAYRMQALHHDV